MSKKAVIVPGVHDPIPPHGRVTVQLTHPDTGRILKEAKAENAVMDWFLSQVGKMNVRGNFTNSSVADAHRYFQPNFNPLSMNIDTLENRDTITAKFNVAGMYPGIYPSGTEVPFIWASSSDISPNSAHTHFPASDQEGHLTAFANTDLVYTTVAGNLPRGTVNPAECRHTYDQSRMVVEWPTTHGAGVYRSIGIGSVTQRNLAHGPGQGAAVGVPLSQINVLKDSLGRTNVRRSAITYGQSEPWNSVTWPDHRWFVTRKTTQDIWIGNFETATGIVGQGPSSATIGGSGQTSVAAHGGQLWVARGTTLKKCDYPTGASLTVNNTYSPVTGFTDAAILDITSDGTNLYLLGISKVFIVNPATGAVTSSWTHSLPRTGSTEIANIEWDPAMQFLWLTLEQFSSTNIPLSWGGDVTNVGLTSLDVSRTYAYSTSGTRLNYALPFAVPALLYSYNTLAIVSGGSAWDGNAICRYASGLTGFAQQNKWACMISSNVNTSNTTSGTAGIMLSGPSMASHAVLDDDVVKDTSTGLKIIYDYNFTDI